MEGTPLCAFFASTWLHSLRYAEVSHNPNPQIETLKTQEALAV